MKICFRGARNLTSCRCIFTEPQMHFFWPTSDSIWNGAILAQYICEYCEPCFKQMTLTAHPLWFAMKLHECHESQPSNFPCSPTSSSNFLVQRWPFELYVDHGFPAPLVLHQQVESSSIWYGAYSSTFENEKKHDSSGYQFGIFWYFNSVITHTNMLSRTPKLISAIQLSMPLRQDFVSKSWVWWKWSV